MRLASLISLRTAALIACGDPPTAPPFDVTVAGPARASARLARTPSGVRYECDSVEVTAVATGGRAGTAATWGGLTFRIVQLSTEVDTYQASYTAETVAAWWGASTLVTGDSRVMAWSANAPYPFRVVLDYQYLAEARERTASVQFVCA